APGAARAGRARGRRLHHLRPRGAGGRTPRRARRRSRRGPGSGSGEVSAMARCSVVIPVHGKASLTAQCLDALFRGPEEGVELEVVVVDDASPDRTEQMLAGYGDRIRVVTHPENTGFAGACNDGAAAASGEFLVFLNNDTVPLPGWLSALV